MPQRAKTPPPPEDEHFMTVHYPYPQHANMEIEEDVQNVARWLGSIVKPAYFNAFYHKPSARNTVIIEVSKTIGDDKRKLLGQHIWKDILKNPTDGEKEHKSGIFYCVYNNIRNVQKEGWKRIDFEDTWFMRKPKDGEKYKSIHYDQAEWECMIQEEGVFHTPYPLSSRCEVPMEDPTNRGFCRPLPVDLFPIPVLPEMPREVPGTLQWAKVKALPEGAWAKSPPKATKGKPGSQAKDKRGRTPAPRSNNVGPPVAPTNSGVNHKSPGSLPPNLVINDKGKGKQRETGEPSSAADELLAHSLAMELGGVEEDPEYQEYYGAGVKDVFASAGMSTETATSPTLPDHDPIDHNGVGVYVDGVTINPVVVEDSLWGDPLEKMNKKLNKDEDVPLCDFHGKICSRGICKVYEKQLREHRKKQKDLKEPKNWREANGGQNDGRGGARSRGGPRRRGLLLRGDGGPGKDFGPRSPTDENRAPRKPNGVAPPRNAWSKPNNSPKVDNAWGADNKQWSTSEMGGSAKPIDRGNSNKGMEGDDDDAARGWSRSELGEGSQADPWSGPGRARDKPIGTKNGTRGKNSAKPGWDDAEELGMEDSVSQHGDEEFRNAPSRNPGKKSWADQVEDGDEMEYANGDEPAPMVAPEPDLEGEDEEGDGWMESRRGKKGKGKGSKARSVTGWSDVTNQGPW